MCTRYSKEATRYLRQKMQKAGGKMVFWKVYKRRRTNLGCYFRKATVKNPGIIKSDRLNQKPGHDDLDGHRASPIYPPIITLYRGIHVYRKKKDALHEADTCRLPVSVVPVVCKVDNLVGAEGAWRTQPCAVFMKVRIRPKDWRKIFPGSAKRKTA